MAKVRVLKILYEDVERTAPGIGEPVRSLEAALRLVTFLRASVDEEAWALVLDAAGRLIGLYQLAKGGRHEALLAPGSLFRTVLMAEGSAVILVHNHPQGGVRPSPADIRTTETILLAGFALGVPLCDHLIVCGTEAYSFRRSGLLAWLQAKQLRALGLKDVPDVRDPREAEAEARAALARLGQMGPPAKARAGP